MPYLNLKISKKLPTSTQEFLAAELTRLMAEILHKEPTLTAITIEELEQSHWFINGELQTIGAHLSINITQNTNTALQKAEMLTAAAQLLNETLGQLPSATYVIIHELPADTWGYDGLSQAARKQIRLAPPPAITLECATLPLDEIDSIAPLWQQLNQLHFEKSLHFAAYYEKHSFDVRKQVFIEKAQQGQLLITVAKHQDKLVGYCVSSVVNNVGEVESLFVSPEHRGADIGETLLKRALSWMDSLKVSSKKIAVYAGNEAVLNFYEKFGFHAKYLILEQVHGN